MGLKELFAGGGVTFVSSPLYQELCTVVTADEHLLGLAGRCPRGQRPPNMLFAAVHLLVLQDSSAELAQWYASVVGPDVARDPAGVGPMFDEFCRVNEGSIVRILGTRLVQTNVVKRAAALRFGLTYVARRTDQPIVLMEIGCSAGALLAQNDYRYRAAGQEWGRGGSPAVIDFEWRSVLSLPELDAVPPICDRTGIDLYAIDPSDPDDRAWMRALVWPENLHEAELLEAALDVVAADPPRRLTGDAATMIAAVAGELPRDIPVVIFHAATRAHVPMAGRGAFDAAIDAVGDSRHLFHLSLEGSAAEWFRPHRGSFLLRLEERGPDRAPVGADLAIVDQHGEWIQPLSGQRRADL